MKALWWFLMMTFPVWAVPNDPAATAVVFLEKVRSKKINLEPGGDTALSAQTSPGKRREIAARLDRMARDLGDDPLEAGGSKLDGELAAVLVRRMAGFDPGGLRVFPVALVKRGEDWLAAPVPASFENAGLGYAADLRKRVAGLQDWMLREQARDLEQLREQSAERMRRKISETLPPETLRGFTAEQAARRFLTACEQRQVPEVLGLLGGLSASPPQDWQARLKAAVAAMAAANARLPWRLLQAREVLRVLVEDDEGGDEARVTVGVLDPAGAGRRAPQARIEFLDLAMSKSPDGLWRMDLPPDFFETPAADPFGEPPVEDDDMGMLGGFFEKLGAQHPPAPQPTAAAAAEALMAALQASGLGPVVQLLAIDPNVETSRRSLLKACALWWELRQAGSERSAFILALHQDGPAAAAILQFFSPLNPERGDLKTLYFLNKAGRWTWSPAVDAATEKTFAEWKNQQLERWQKDWQDHLLTECTSIQALPDEGSPPTPDAAREVVAGWLQAVRNHRVKEALRFTARLDLPDSRSATLRNLGYEMTGLNRSHRPPEPGSIVQRGIWAAVACRSGPDDAPVQRFYPLVETPAGAKILLEADLVAGGNRSREFLNKTSFSRLRKAGAGAAAELAGLFAEYQEQSRNTGNR